MSRADEALQKSLDREREADGQSNHRPPNEVVIGGRRVLDPYANDPEGLLKAWGPLETLTDAFAKRDPMVYLVRDFIKVTDIVTIYAGSAVGKTIASINLGMAQVLKQEWLPRVEEQPFNNMLEGMQKFSTMGVPYIHFNLEMSADRMRDLVRATAVGYGLSGDREELEELGFYYKSLMKPRLELAYPSSAEALILWLNEVKEKHGSDYAMFGIDPLTSASYELNQYLPEMRIAMDNLKRVCDEANSSNLLLHHANKGDGNYRGTPVIMEGSDVMIEMSVPNDSRREIVSFECIKSRDEWVQPFAAERIMENVSVMLDGVDFPQRKLVSAAMIRSMEDTAVPGKRNKLIVAQDVAKVVLDRYDGEIQGQGAWADLTKAEVETGQYGYKTIGSRTCTSAIKELIRKGEVVEGRNYKYRFAEPKKEAKDD